MGRDGKVNALNIKTEIWLLACSISGLKIWPFNFFNFSAFPVYILNSVLHGYQPYNKVIVKWYSSQSSFCKLPEKILTDPVKEINPCINSFCENTIYYFTSLYFLTAVNLPFIQHIQLICFNTRMLLFSRRVFTFW